MPQQSHVPVTLTDHFEKLQLGSLVFGVLAFSALTASPVRAECIPELPDRFSVTSLTGTRPDTPTGSELQFLDVVIFGGELKSPQEIAEGLSYQLGGQKVTVSALAQGAITPIAGIDGVGRTWYGVLFKRDNCQRPEFDPTTVLFIEIEVGASIFEFKDGPEVGGRIFTFETPNDNSGAISEPSTVLGSLIFIGGLATMRARRKLNAK